MKAISARIEGHFGELLQGRLGPSGPVALITLPCPILAAHATARPGAFALHQSGPRSLPPATARKFLQRLGLPMAQRLTLRLDMPPGAGAGASTTALLALARAAGWPDHAALRPALIAACLEVEGATDPLAFPSPERQLWASREGRALAALPWLPPMEILGGFLGPGQRTNPRDMAFPDISDLAAQWPAACGNLPALAQLASTSAQRSLTLRGPANDPTARLAAATGALGWTIAHTGSARALIFAPGTIPDSAPARLRAAGLTRLIRFRPTA